MDQEKRGLGCSQEVESLPGPGSETEVGGGRVALLPTRSISTRPVGIGSRELPGLQLVPSSGLQLCCPSRTQPLVKGSEFRPEGPTCWFCPRQSFRGYLRRKVSRGVLRLECATEDWQWPLVCAHQADLQARQPMWGLSQSWSHQETCHLSPSSTRETASPHPYVPM